ncbi:MAG: hypothetical protein K2P93_05610 [Alphaproteobacteria bacterium]|nr:hypothetical protein [Alphaproteobacteria bacterium]
MKTLTTFAFVVMVAISMSTAASAYGGLRMEGVQNFMYYFGAPCPTPCAMVPAPCAVPCAMPCPIPCPEIHGIFM